MQRQLISDYVAQMEAIIAQLDRVDLESALAIAKLPEQIRGYGHVWEESLVAAQVRWRILEESLLTHRAQMTAEMASAQPPALPVC